MSKINWVRPEQNPNKEVADLNASTLIWVGAQEGDSENNPPTVTAVRIGAEWLVYTQFPPLYCWSRDRDAAAKRIRAAYSEYLKRMSECPETVDDVYAESALRVYKVPSP